MTLLRLAIVGVVLLGGTAPARAQCTT